MKKILGFLGLLFVTTAQVLFSGPGLASTAKCDEALRDSDLFVRDARMSCATLTQCLVRRDTCVADGLPNTQEKCEGVDECMANREADFADSAQCRYQWSRIDSTFKCSVKRKLFAAQDRCPGRILLGIGLLGLSLFSGDTINYAVDSKFNCEAVNAHFKHAVVNLERARARVVRFCLQGSGRAELFATPSCAESSDFRPNSDGRYALPVGVSNGTQIQQGSGTGHEGGGEESGGGGGPKSKAR